MMNDTGKEARPFGPLPKAMLLDLDDTILTYEQGVDKDECWRHAIGKHLPDPYTVHLDDMLASIIEKAKWFWSDPERHRIGRLDLLKAREDIVSAVLPEWDIRDPLLARKIAETYDELRDRAFRLFPDAMDALERFRSHGIKLAMVTNGRAETQWNKIRRFNLEPLFECILVEGELGFGKPETAVYLLALEQLGAAAEETWMIGDNYAWEVEAPQRLGIKGIWIDHAGAGVPAGASEQPFMIIKSLGDLAAVMPEV